MLEKDSDRTEGERQASDVPADDANGVPMGDDPAERIEEGGTPAGAPRQAETALRETRPRKKRRNVYMALVAFTPERRQQFVDAVMKHGTLAQACAIVQVSRTTVERHAQSDPDFQAACLAAMESFRGALQEEARRRAVDGVEKPVYQGGELVGHVREYSDRLLIKHLDRHCPEFRDATPEAREVRITAGLSAQIAEMTDEGRAKLRSLLEQLDADAASRVKPILSGPSGHKYDFTPVVDVTPVAGPGEPAPPPLHRDTLSPPEGPERAEDEET